MTASHSINLNNDPKAKIPKSTKIVRQLRIEKIAEFYLMGYQLSDIFHLVNNGGIDGEDDNMRWGISWKACWDILDLAKSKVREHINPINFEEKLRESIERWTILLKMSISRKDISNAIKASKELDEVLGLRTHNINLSGSISTLQKMSDEQIDEQIMKFINKENQ